MSRACPPIIDLLAAAASPAGEGSPHAATCERCRAVVSEVVRLGVLLPDRERLRDCDSVEIALAAADASPEADALAPVFVHFAHCDACRERALFKWLYEDTPAPVEQSNEADIQGLTRVDRAYYHFGELLAQGGMGQILRARDVRTGRPVAIKQIRQDRFKRLTRPEQLAALQRFEREARLTARLQHPSIVPVYEIGELGEDDPFFAMKLVADKPLRSAIAARETLSERLELLPNVVAVAEALAYAHANGVIHRDLKPDNILVGEFGETIVIDWGLAKDIGTGGLDAAEEPADELDIDIAVFARGLAGLPAASAPAADQVTLDVDDAEMPELPAHDGLTGFAAVLGTPGFMAPEQARGDVADERADVWALGAILYQVVTGHAPYDEMPTAVAVIDATRERPPVHATKHQPHLARALVDVLDRALAFDRDDRYPTARELALDLAQLRASNLEVVRCVVGDHEVPRHEADILANGYVCQLCRSRAAVETAWGRRHADAILAPEADHGAVFTGQRSSLLASVVFIVLAVIIAPLGIAGVPGALFVSALLLVLGGVGTVAATKAMRQESSKTPSSRSAPSTGPSGVHQIVVLIALATVIAISWLAHWSGGAIAFAALAVLAALCVRAKKTQPALLCGILSLAAAYGGLQSYFEQRESERQVREQLQADYRSREEVQRSDLLDLWKSRERAAILAAYTQEALDLAARARAGKGTACSNQRAFEQVMRLRADSTTSLQNSVLALEHEMLAAFCAAEMVVATSECNNPDDISRAWLGLRSHATAADAAVVSRLVDGLEACRTNAQDDAVHRRRERIAKEIADTETLDATLDGRVLRVDLRDSIDIGAVHAVLEVAERQHHEDPELESVAQKFLFAVTGEQYDFEALGFTDVVINHHSFDVPLSFEFSPPSDKEIVSQWLTDLGLTEPLALH